MVMTPLWQVAHDCGVHRNDVLAACARLDIPANRVGSLLRPDQVKRLRDYFKPREATARGRTASGLPPQPQGLAPAPPSAMRLRPRNAAMYNVSEISDVPPIDRDPVCDCCGMRFARHPDDKETRHCPRCQLHYPVAGETSERELARLRDHDQRLRPGYAAAWHFQRQYEDRMKGALHSRDNWKAALAEVVLAHEAAADGKCKLCHEKDFPCSTWRKLERANRGIHREVESLSALDDDELSRELYGDVGDYRSA